MLLVECLLPKYIKIPSGTVLQENAKAFKIELGLPQCVEDVDETRIIQKRVALHHPSGNS